MRQRRSDGRHHAERQRSDEIRRQVIERLGLAVYAVERVGGLRPEPCRALQAVETQRVVQQIEHREHRRSQRDGDADAQELPRDGGAAARIVGLPRAERRVVAPLVQSHIGQRGESAGGYAENGAGGRAGQAEAAAGDHPGQRQADDQLAYLLHHLSEGGGDHVPASLAVAAVGRRGAYDHHGGSERRNAQRGLSVPHHGGQLPVEQEHRKRKESAYAREHGHGHVEGPLHPGGLFPGVGHGDHPRERDGEAGRGQRENEPVNIIGHGKVGEALVSEEPHAAQGDLVKERHHLHDDRGPGHDRRAVEIILLFSSGQTVCPPYILGRERFRGRKTSLGRIRFDYSTPQPA